MTDRAWLEARSARWLHRSDYTTADFDDAIEAVTLELGQTLRHSINQETIDVAESWTAPIELRADVREVDSVEIDGEELDTEPLGYVRRWIRNASGQGRFFAVSDLELWIAAPSRAGSYVAFIEPAAIGSAADATNAVLTAFPHLYRYGVLEQLAQLAQEFDVADGFGNAFRARVAQLNEQHRRLSWGTAPASRRV